MGLFKRARDAQKLAADGQALAADALHIQAEAQRQRDVQRDVLAAAAAADPVAAQAAAAGGMEAIAGVSIELYATISKRLADRGGDQALAPTIAEEHGIAAANWHSAVAGWNERMSTDPSVGAAFSAHYRTA